MAKAKPKIEITAQPLLVDTVTAARMCNLSKRFWIQLDNSGKIPQPIYLGKRKLWRVSDLQQWAAMGCPSRRDFQANNNSFPS
jgi:predicted DNA-binding transcriptional regulator AlpA